MTDASVEQTRIRNQVATGQSIASLPKENDNSKEGANKKFEELRRQMMDTIFAQLKGQDPTDPDMDTNSLINTQANLIGLQEQVNTNQKLAEIAESLGDTAINKGKQYVNSDIEYDNSRRQFFGREVEFEYTVDSPEKTPGENSNIETAINVKDKDGKIVYQTTQSNGQLGNNKFVWDGTTQQGDTASPGEYSIEVRSTLKTKGDSGEVVSQEPLSARTTLRGTVNSASVDKGVPLLHVNGDTITTDDIVSISQTNTPNSGQNQNQFEQHDLNQFLGCLAKHGRYQDINNVLQTGTINGLSKGDNDEVMFDIGGEQVKASDLQGIYENNNSQQHLTHLASNYVGKFVESVDDKFELTPSGGSKDITLPNLGENKSYDSVKLNIQDSQGNLVKQIVKSADELNYGGKIAQPQFSELAKHSKQETLLNLHENQVADMSQHFSSNSEQGEDLSTRIANSSEEEIDEVYNSFDNNIKQQIDKFIGVQFYNGNLVDKTYEQSSPEEKQQRLNAQVGINTINWDGKTDTGEDLSSGEYQYQLEAKIKNEATGETSTENIEQKNKIYVQQAMLEGSQIKLAGNEGKINADDVVAISI